MTDYWVPELHNESGTPMVLYPADENGVDVTDDVDEAMVMFRSESACAEWCDYHQNCERGQWGPERV